MVKKILAKSYVVLLLILFYAPIVVLVVFSFTDSDKLGVWDTFTWKLYRDVFRDEGIMNALKNTIEVALTSAFFATVIGTMGAVGIFYSKKRAKETMTFLSQIPVMNAEIVMALSLILLFTILGIRSSFFTLIVGHIVLTAPFVVLSVTPKLKQMNPNIYEAALDLGAKPAEAIFRVMIPEILPGIFSGFLLAVTLSSDDYIITAFLRNKDYDTLSTYVEGITKKGPLPPVLRSLTSFIFVFIFIILLIIDYRIVRNEKKEIAKK